MIKNYFPLCLVLIVLSSHSFAQENNKTLNHPIITSTILTANTIYIVPEEILVSNNATLTIEEGVMLKNQNNHKITIVIDNGSKVVASGSYDNPIKVSTNSENKEKPVIIMRSSGQDGQQNIADNNFYYESIENPTIWMSPKSTNTEISSVQSDF